MTSGSYSFATGVGIYFGNFKFKTDCWCGLLTRETPLGFHSFVYTPSMCTQRGGGVVRIEQEGMVRVDLPMSGCVEKGRSRSRIGDIVTVCFLGPCKCVSTSVNTRRYRVSRTWLRFSATILCCSPCGLLRGSGPTPLSLEVSGVVSLKIFVTFQTMH